MELETTVVGLVHVKSFRHNNPWSYEYRVAYRSKIQKIFHHLTYRKSKGT